MRRLKAADLARRSLNDRIKAVLHDLTSRADRYCKIPAHDLAGLLGIDDSRLPGGDWTRITYVRRVPLAEYLEFNQRDGSLFDCLNGKVAKTRVLLIQKLRDQYDETGEFDVASLNRREIRIVEDAICADTLDNIGAGSVIALRSIKAGRGRDLCFEAFIEDDGTCIDLLTPYDKRDGKFTDLSECLTDP